MMVEPVIHHVEICCRNPKRTITELKRYGLRPFATKENTFCKQVALKLNNIVFIVNEKTNARTLNYRNGSFEDSPLTVMCSRCENGSDEDHVDTVFNIALNVKSVKKFFTRAVERIKCDFEKCIVQDPTIVEDEYGKIEYCIIKSLCGNVIHVCLNKDDYKGYFLPGFKTIENVDDVYSEDCTAIKENVTQIDHITLATHTGLSEEIINFYTACFGMEKFTISSNDDEEKDGLVLREGVGLRLRAMEFFRCNETGLICPSSRTKSGERTPNSLMLVVVESLVGQTNCNVQTFLKQHESPGVEHIAFATRNILDSVSEMKKNGVEFRLPPECYYTELKQRPQIKEIADLNFDEIEKHGILLDREEDPEIKNGEIIESKPKYLMQIFAMPIFQRKTFFIEVIQRRHGAKGLGAGNIVALIKSIREDERRKAAEGADKCHSTKDVRLHRRIS